MFRFIIFYIAAIISAILVLIIGPLFAGVTDTIIKFPVSYIILLIPTVLIGCILGEVLYSIKQSKVRQLWIGIAYFSVLGIAYSFLIAFIVFGDLSELPYTSLVTIPGSIVFYIMRFNLEKRYPIGD